MRQRRARKDKHRQGLGDEMENPMNNGVRVYPHKKKRKRDAEEEKDDALTAKISGRILKVAREQQDEVDAEDADTALQRALGGDAAARLGAGALKAALRRAADSDDDDSDLGMDDELPSTSMRAQAGKGKQHGGIKKPPGLNASDDDDDEDDVDRELKARTLKAGAGADSEYVDIEEEEVSPEDERALAAFMAPSTSGANQQSLGDVILSKLREKQKEQGMNMLPEEGAEDEDMVPEGLDDKVVQVYRAVGKLLSRYTVGKLPKAFKIIPNLKNWEEVLWLTEPDMWSPHAMYEAAKMFVSNLNARLAQRFLALVLLPRVRQEIREKQKLHFALFMALKKATYKPGAFYKGILLPLCQTRTCTLREAVIMTSVLKRTSIPVLHSAAALLRLADMEYCGTTSFFMRVLLDKKYALPYRVIDGLVDHFARFADDERQMPVVWHQTLLCFVQRYKDEIRPEDRTVLRKLCSIQNHYLVSPEIVRELDHSKGRGAAAPSTTTAAPGPSFAPNAAFNAGAGFGGLGRAFGAAAHQAQSRVAVIGKTVTENIKSMPPVMIMEDD